MFIKELKCSNCGSNDFKQIKENKFSCTYCGTINYIHNPEQKKEFSYTTTSYNETNSGNNPNKMFAIFGIAFSLCVAAATAFLLSNSIHDYETTDSNIFGSKKPKEIEINGKMYLDTLTTKINHPDIKVAWYEMSDTSHFEWWKGILIVGEIENNSGAVWKYPSIEFTFYNKGLKVGNNSTKLDQEYILPKSRESFSIEWSFPQMFDSVDITNKAEPFFFHPPQKLRSFKISDEKFYIRNDYEAILEGVFENLNSYSINISGVVKYYDADGKYVGANNIYSGLLKKGEKTKFSNTSRFIKDPKTTNPKLMRKPESYKYFFKTDSIPG